MPLSIDRLINVLVTLTLIEMMVAIGLSVTLTDLVGVARNWGLLARAALSNYVLVPAVTAVLLVLFRPHPMVCVGFLILAACPGAPYGPPFAAIAKGNVPVAVGLMAILAGSSAILAPLLLLYLLPLVSENEMLSVDAGKIVRTLLFTQLLPLCFGIALRQWRPPLADRLQKPAISLSKLLNITVVGLILFAQFRLLADIRPRGWMGMLALLVSSWIVGWPLGGSDGVVRRTMTLTTSMRNVGVGLVIASGAFPGTAAVTATLAYGLFAVIGSLVLAKVWGQRPVPGDRMAVLSADLPNECPTRP
jgi:BASS family bile acid:Na+ symporter